MVSAMVQRVHRCHCTMTGSHGWTPFPIRVRARWSVNSPWPDPLPLFTWRIAARIICIHCASAVKANPLPDPFTRWFIMTGVGILAACLMAEHAVDGESLALVAAHLIACFPLQASINR
jgi:hypothetical protein